MTHDLFFKRLIETLFEQLFEELLLKVYQRIDVTTITPMKDSFIQKELEQFYSDLLFRVLLDGNEGYLYFLFEHKSYSDPQIAFQMLQYMLAIWMRELEEKAEEMNYFETVVLYLFNVSESFSVDTLKERLTVEGRKKLMTIAEQLKQKGREEGKEEGRLKEKRLIALKMLKLNMDEREIIQLTGLAEREIVKLKREL